MSSRETILATVKGNQPPASALPPIVNYDQHYENVTAKYMEVLRFIGGDVHLVQDYTQIQDIIKDLFKDAKRMVTTAPEFLGMAEKALPDVEAHLYADVDLFITTSGLAVAENGSFWVKDDQLPNRVLPFIAQQVVVIIKKDSIVATMHDAYDIIADADYGYAAFIAGPSKTADIAQSLVLGAHGPKGMTVFILEG